MPLQIVPGKFSFLGSGGSMGIPVIGCHCAVCQSSSKFNKRLRPSALVTIEKRNFLIDCGPDFRQQALKYHIDSLDGLLLTHAHHDHIGGIDELRVYQLHQKNPIPCFLSKYTAAELRTRFSYIFEDNDKLISRLNLHIFKDIYGIEYFNGLQIKYITYEQAGMFVNGFRLGDLAYVSDIKLYSDLIFDHLKGVNILILSALRWTSSAFHFSIDEAIEFASKVGAKQTWLTHISHELDHEKTNAYLPTNVRMAYDGLEFSFNAIIDPRYESCRK